MDAPRPRHPGRARRARDVLPHRPAGSGGARCRSGDRRCRPRGRQPHVVAPEFLAVQPAPHGSRDRARPRHPRGADRRGASPLQAAVGMVNAAMWRALERTAERCVFWSLQPEGLRARSAEAQAAYVVKRAGPGAIVDLHDAEGVAGAPARLIAALPAMLDGLREAGYRLTTVADLLGDPR